MLKVCAIASGSNGNCYYIGNAHEAILVDSGISARRTIARLHERNLDPSVIKAILITHEHTDHTAGVRVLSKKLKIPVYLTSATYKAMYSNYKPYSPCFFKPGDMIRIGSFQVFTFTKSHDAAEPCSFRVEYDGMNTGVFTDIGNACDHVITQLSMCHALFLETNYDEKMLWEGSYPWPLKKRIASDHGHLSNDQAFELLKNYSGSNLQVVFLSHLSAENNTPDKAIGRFEGLSNRYAIKLTSRISASEVIHLSNNTLHF